MKEVCVIVRSRYVQTSTFLIRSLAQWAQIVFLGVHAKNMKNEKQQRAAEKTRFRCLLYI